jgi:hypothetical protein
MTRLNIRGLLALFLTVLTLGLGQVPASAQVIGRVPYLSPNPCKGVTLSLAFARSTGSNCLNGSRYASVTNMPGWTYTGGTPAGTGSYAPKADGSLQFFPSATNLETYSEQFDNAAWSKQAATITANAVTAPNGTLTADKLEETATTNIHWAYQDPAAVANTTYTLSAYLKAAERTKARAALINSDGTNVSETIVDLTAGSIVSATGTATITSAGNGWWRVTLTGTLNGTATRARTYLQTALADNSFNYAGTAGSGIYIWGAQLELGSTASTYIPTTTAAVTVAPARITDAGYLAEEARTNLLVYSQDFTTQGAGFWQLQASSTVSGNAATAPDGTATADLWTRVTTAASYFTQTKTKAASATTYTHSMYVKKSVGNYYAIRIQGTYPARVDAVFDLSTGTIATAAVVSGSFTSPSATIEPAANGFYLVTITATSDATTALQVVGSFLSTNVQVDGTDSASNSAGYIWQADLQVGSFATSPIPTTSVAVTRAADVGYISGLTVPSAWTLSESHVAQGALVNLNVAAELNDGSVNNRAFTAQNGSATLFANVTVGGAGGAGASITVPTSGNVNAAITTSGSNLLFAANGSAVSTAATSLPANTSLTRLYVGNRADTARAFGGSIRRVVIYPRAMSNAELQAITTAGAY